jgi:hypothetical protein
MQHYGGSFMSVVDTRLQESWENEQWSASKSMNSEVLPRWMSWNQEEVVWGYDITYMPSPIKSNILRTIVNFVWGKPQGHTNSNSKCHNNGRKQLCHGFKRMQA